MRVLVTGATGLLGGYIVEETAKAGFIPIACGGPTRPSGLDLEDDLSMTEVITSAQPDVVIHAAALSSVADCVADGRRARRINVDGTALLARATRAAGARFVFVSTDMVFDGEAAPYVEEAKTDPRSVYGATKRDAEVAALAESDGRVVVVRVSLLFGPTKTARRGFFDEQLARLRSPAPLPATLRLFEDEWRTPLALSVAAKSLVTIATCDPRRLTARTLHLGGPARLSRWEMGIALADAFGLPADQVEKSSRLSSAAPEPRARDLSLDTTLVRSLFPELVDELHTPFDVACRAMTGVDRAPA